MSTLPRLGIAALIAAPLLLCSATAWSQQVGAPNGTWTPAPPATSPQASAVPAPLPTLPPQTTTVTLIAETSPAPPPRPTAAAVPPDADVTYEPKSPRDRLVEQRFLNGFRLGYAYVANYDKPVESLGGQSLKDRIDMKTPHHFLLGYEGVVRMVGHSWLNVILVGNVMVAGVEQSKFYPTGNALLGFEIDNSFQVGVGTSLTPLRGQEAHAIAAAGWTPRVGGFYVPVHAFVIPDVDGLHRTGVTTGVTW